PNVSAANLDHPSPAVGRPQDPIATTATTNTTGTGISDPVTNADHPIPHSSQALEPIAATSALGFPAARVDHPTGGLSQVPDAGASRAPEQQGAGWNATGDGQVPTSSGAAWTRETLPQSGTVQPNMQAQPPSAPAIMNADTAARAAPIFR